MWILLVPLALWATAMVVMGNPAGTKTRPKLNRVVLNSCGDGRCEFYYAPDSGPQVLLGTFPNTNSPKQAVLNGKSIIVFFGDEGWGFR
jgi:hypothetical protein